MVVLVAMTTACVVSLGFYVLFFAAMCKERSYTTICRLVCMEPENAKEKISEISVRNKSFVRAA
jgi:hypothetical protein